MAKQLMPRQGSVGFANSKSGKGNTPNSKSGKGNTPGGPQDSDAPGKPGNAPPKSGASQADLTAKYPSSGRKVMIGKAPRS